MEFKYKTTFASQIAVLKSTDKVVQEVKASIADLKDLMPFSIDPEADKDLVYIVGNLAVAGVMNLNDDIMDCETAIATYKKFEKKQVNIEHDRQNIVGFILRAGLSEIGTDKIITEAEARAFKQPFNIATVSVLWKVANPELCQYIINQSAPESEDFGKLSFSFEVGFDDYNIATVLPNSRCLCDNSMIIKAGNPEFEDYNKLLRVNKGSGKKGDALVGRILEGNVTPLGEGIVRMPAGAVKGILAILPTEKDTDLVAVPAAVIIPEINLQEEQAKIDEVEQKKAIQKILSDILFIFKRYNRKEIFVKSSVSFPSNKIVSNNITNYLMKPEVIQEAFAALKKADTLEAFKIAVAGINPIADAIIAENDRYVRETEAAKNLANTLEQAKKDAITASEKAKSDLDEVRKELDTIKAKQAAVEAQAKFDARIAAIVEEYELGDEERAIVVAQIKDLDDAAFASWQTSAKVMLKDKSKKVKSEKKKAMEDALCKAGVKLTVDASTLNFDEIFAKIAEVKGQDIDNTLIIKKGDLKTEMEQAFSGIVTVNGKKVKE